MRNVFGVALLILAASSVSAQNGKGDLPMTVIVQAGSSCPVGFGANLSGRAVMHSVNDAGRDRSAQLLELSFVALHTPSLKRAGITVHGISQKGRLLPVANSPADDVIQAFALSPSVDSTGLTQAHVWITRVAAAHWVEITDLDYVDGSSWHASKGSVCRAELGGLKLVASRVP